MNVTDNQLRDAVSWFVGAGIVLAIIGGSILNSAYSEFDPAGGQLAFGWLVIGIGGMAMQAGFVGLLWWVARRRPAESASPAASGTEVTGG
jgi:hypothetical protein